MELAFSFSTNKRKPQTRSAAGTLANPPSWLQKLWSGFFNNSTTVNQHNALRLSSVYACIRNISEDLASLPIEHQRRLSDGSIEKIRNSPLVSLLNDRPNAILSGVEMRECIQGQVLSRGNGIARIERNGANRPVQIHYYPTEDVYITNVQGKLYYKFPDLKEALPYYEVLHVRAFSTNGELGISPIMQHALTIKSGLAAKNMNTKFYENGSWLKGILEFQGELSPERSKELGNQWDNNFGGDENAYKTPVTHAGMKFNPITIPQREAQYIESMKFTREEIAGIYRVPPYMIGDTTTASFNSMEQLNIQYVTYTLRPYVKKWEKELSHKLLTKAQRDAGERLKFNMNALLRGDIETRGEYYAKMMSHGVYSPNDVRALEGDNPRDGGNRYFTQVNTQTQKQTELQEEKLAKEIEQIGKQE